MLEEGWAYKTRSEGEEEERKKNGKGATFSFGGAQVHQQGIVAERTRTPDLILESS